MSLYNKVYHCTDRAPERELSPPEERAALLCPECGGLLYSSQAVRREELFGDVLGCEVCSDWKRAEGLDAPPGRCPNCGEALGGGDRVLVSDGGVPLACGYCADDRLAVDCCAGVENGASAALGCEGAARYGDADGFGGAAQHDCVAGCEDPGRIESVGRCEALGGLAGEGWCGAVALFDGAARHGGVGQCDGAEGLGGVGAFAPTGRCECTDGPASGTGSGGARRFGDSAKFVPAERCEGVGGCDDTGGAGPRAGGLPPAEAGAPGKVLGLARGGALREEEAPACG